MREIAIIKTGLSNSAVFFQLRKFFKMDSQKKLDLEGNLNRHSVAEILVEISQAGLSGALRLENGEQKFVIYFEDGDLVFAASNARKHKLFEILLRENKITPQQLGEIKDFVNDLKLKEFLLFRKIISKEELRNIFERQFSLILLEAVAWEEGKWIFTPLARVRDEMRQPFDLHKLLFEYGRNLSGAESAQRLKSFQEIFRIRKKPSDFALQPTEAFILSRFEDRHLTIESMRDLSGMSESETFRILYGLWLGGFLNRENWNAAFSYEKLNEINSARLKLKTSAPELEKPKRENTLPPPEKTPEKKKPEKEAEITLEQYLEQIENAENHYEKFAVEPDASEAKIKAAYFALAKQFHPDLFYRKVEVDKHNEIQQAFTSIAQAYETLRNKETREVYDYKMRKNIEFKTQKVQSDGSVIDDATGQHRSQAAQIFENGFTLLMDENFEQALPYLARAVDLVGDNAKYHAYYGRALAENGRKHQAEAELQTAVKLDAKNADYRLMLIKLFIEVGLPRRAAGELNRLLEIAPDNYEAKTLLDSLPAK